MMIKVDNLVNKALNPPWLNSGLKIVNHISGDEYHRGKSPTGTSQFLQDQERA